MRATAQMISYEISITLIISTIIITNGSFNLIKINNFQIYLWYFLPLYPCFIMFFVSCLAETNRSPFDLTEGESELVSGYNVEYSSMSFALFFLSEYSHIIFSSFLISIIFLGGNNLINYNNFNILSIKSIIISSCFVWIRTSFPRYRYDQLMYLCWKSYLPINIFIIFICIFLIHVLKIYIYF